MTMQRGRFATVDRMSFRRRCSVCSSQEICKIFSVEKAGEIETYAAVSNASGSCGKVHHESPNRRAQTPTSGTPAAGAPATVAARAAVGSISAKEE